MFLSQWIRKPDFRDLKPFTYDGYWDFRGFRIENALKPREKIMASLIKPGTRVLDIGCGNSRLPLALKEKGVDVTVGDIVPSVLEEYRKLGVSGISIDLEDIPSLAKLASYDVIILSEVLEHMRYPEDVLRALVPHAKRFLITVPNSAAYVFRYGLMFRGRFFTQWVHHPSEHLRYWSHIDFLDWLSAMGLTVAQSIPSDGLTVRNMMPWLPSLWKNLFAYRLVYDGRPS